MRAPLWILALALTLPVATSSADQAESLREQAAILRSLRAQIDAAPASTKLYEQYFEHFPASFADLQQMLVADRPNDPLLRSGEKWDYGQAYVTLMCRTFDHVDHRQYMRKILRIGVGAGAWGGPGKSLEDRYGGDIYLRLIHRYPCTHLTEQQAWRQRDVIYGVLPEFSDAELTAIYHATAWDEGEQKIRLDWFLNKVCSLYPARCELTRKLRDSFKESRTAHH